MSDVSSIEREVEAARSRLSSTIDKIQDKLTVSGIVDEVMGATGVPRLANGHDAVLSVFRRHPVPIMLAAAGVGWLIYRMNRSGALLDAPLIDVAIGEDGEARVYDPTVPTLHPRIDARSTPSQI